MMMKTLMEVMVMEVMEMELEMLMGMEMEDGWLETEHIQGDFSQCNGDGVGDVDAEGDGGRLA